MTWTSGTLPDVFGTGVSVVAGGIGGPDNECLLFTQTTGNATAVEWDFGSPVVGSMAVRAYIKTPTAWPSGAFNFITLRQGRTTTIANLSISGVGQPGQIRLTAGGSTLASAPTNTLSTDTWYRVEMHYAGTDAYCRVGVFEMGANTPLWSSDWQPAAGFDKNVQFVQIGNSNTNPVVGSFNVDEIYFDDLPDDYAWLGRSAYDEETGGPGGGGTPTLPIDWTAGELPSVTGENVTVVAEGLGPENSAIRIEDALGAPTYVEWDLGTTGSTTDLSARAYFKTPASWSTTAFNLLTFWSSPSKTNAALTISGAGQPGQIRLTRPGGVPVESAPNNTIAFDTWYRVELQYNGSEGAARVAVFGLQSNTPMWASPWSEHADFAESIRYIRLGNPANSPVVPSFLVDDIHVRDEPGVLTWIGRAAHDTLVEGGSQGSYYIGRGASSNVGLTSLATAQNSGLAHSLDHDVLWSITDTGGGSKNELYALSTTDATLQATITLPGLAALDIESVCVSHFDGKIYVADIGNSTGGRTANGTLEISVISEPASLSNATITPKIHPITYSDSTNRDAESLAIRPSDGRLFIISKDDGTLWSAPALAPSGVTVFYPVEGVPSLGSRISGMDISPDGYFAIITEGDTDTFKMYRISDWTVVDTWQHTLPGNLEAVCWSRDGTGIYYANDTQNNSLGSNVYYLPIFREGASGGDPDPEEPGEEVEISTTLTPSSVIKQGIPLPVIDAWEPAREYKRGALVAHGGRTYRCLLAGIGKTPSMSSTHWATVGIDEKPDNTFSGYVRSTAGTVQLRPGVSFFDALGKPVGEVRWGGASEASNVPVVDTFGEHGLVLGGRTPTRAHAGRTWVAHQGTIMMLDGSAAPTDSYAGLAVATIDVPSALATSVSVTWGEHASRHIPAVVVRWTDNMNWVRITNTAVQQRSGGATDTLATLSSPTLPGDRVSVVDKTDGTLQVFRSRDGSNYVSVATVATTAAAASKKRGVLWEIESDVPSYFGDLVTETF